MKFRPHLSVITLFLVAFFASPGIHAQSSVRDLERYMTQLRKDPYQTLPATVWQDAKNEDKLLNVLVPYYSDTVQVIRQKAYYITKRIGQKSKEAFIQQRAISYIVNALKEKDSGMSGSALEALTRFRKQNFSAAAKDSIATLIKPETPHLDNVLKLAGFLELKNYADKIQNILATSTNAKLKWSARLALARMGDENAIQFIVNKLNTAQVNDDFVYDVVPDLVYTRQAQIFDFLEGVINSEAENCQSANPDSGKKILCGYRVMEQLAPVIKDFPVKIDESGDLAVSDYPAALQQVRAWFAANDSYSILSDSF